MSLPAQTINNTPQTFEPSFVGIRQILIEIGYLNMNFTLEILANFEFLGVSNWPNFFVFITKIETGR